MKTLLEFIDEAKDGKLEYSRELFIATIETLQSAYDKHDGSLSEMFNLECEMLFGIVMEGISDLFRTIESRTDVLVAYLLLVCKTQGIESVFDINVKELASLAGTDDFSGKADNLYYKIQEFFNKQDLKSNRGDKS